MKSLKTILTFVLFNILVLSMAYAESNKDINLLIESLKGKDAYEALKIANELREKNSNINSRVDAEAVTFIFPDQKRISIPLPDDRMVVAIAPYINRTHR